MSIKLTILGCHSATPRLNAHPTAQFLEIKERHFLIDCGEGTQTLLRKHKVQFAKIKHIFISHLHGDHFYGLIGLISTFGLHNRENDLHIYGPKGIKEVITLQLKLAKSWTKYHLYFHELENKESELIFEDKKVQVFTIPLDHRVYTNGFLFKEKLGERKLNMDAIQLNPEVEICDYHNLKKGKDFVYENGIDTIANEKLTFPPKKPLSYAFCSDTAYKPDIVPFIKSVDLLYHESTFLEDKKELTTRTKHSTAKEAASIAKQAEVKQLILGHYSSRYDDLEKFREEAQSIFSNVSLAESGKIFEIF
ncbi:ribonuclease Z [Flavicella marina]|uniref:ribonuclease Z n=1 Tax=Flavicella marina TaxID=1475951 RepID=UPI00186B3BCA|nr:ribonuclease Z [Flavicella marina]